MACGSHFFVEFVGGFLETLLHCGTSPTAATAIPAFLDNPKYELDIINLLGNTSDSGLIEYGVATLNMNMNWTGNGTNRTNVEDDGLTNSINSIAYCVILPSICLIGVAGNIANLVTLSSPRLRSVSYRYLRALAIADLSCMIFVLLFCSTMIIRTLKMADLNSWPVVFYKAHFMLTFINYSVTVANLVVVSLTIERYISVCFPIFFRQWSATASTFAMCAISLSYGVPLLMYVPYCALRYEMVNLSNGTWGKEDGRYLKSLPYQSYEYTREALFKGIPIMTLMVLNIQIMIAFRRRMHARQRLRNTRPGATAVPSNASLVATNSTAPIDSTSALPTVTSHSKIQKSGSSRSEDFATQQPQTTTTAAPKQKADKDKNAQRDDTLLYLLGGIVLMFFICNIPAALNLVIITEHIKKFVAYAMFRACANLLEIANHASNFYVFCMCSSEYRATFVDKFPKVHNAYRRWRRIRRRVTARLRYTMLAGGQRSSSAVDDVGGTVTMGGTSSLQQSHVSMSPAINELGRDTSELTALKTSDPEIIETTDAMVIRTNEDVEPTEADTLLGPRDDTFTSICNNGDIKFMSDSDDDTVL